MLMIKDGFDWWALKLTLVNVAVFGLAQAFHGQFYGNLVLVSSDLLSRPWTIITSMFMHSGLTHLYFNMFALAVFGSIFEKQVGSRTFMSVYFIGGIVSGIVGAFFYSALLGASGAIFAVLACMAVYRPKTVVWAMGVPMYVMVALFLWIAIDFAGIIQPDNVAHFSHLAGMAYGGAYGYILRTRNPDPGKEKPDEPEDMPTEKELEEWERARMMNP